MGLPVDIVGGGLIGGADHTGKYTPDFYKLLMIPVLNKQKNQQKE